MELAKGEGKGTKEAEGKVKGQHARTQGRVEGAKQAWPSPPLGPHTRQIGTTCNELTHNGGRIGPAEKRGVGRGSIRRRSEGRRSTPGAAHGAGDRRPHMHTSHWQVSRQQDMPQLERGQQREGHS